MTTLFLDRYVYRGDAALLFEPATGLRQALDPIADEMVRELVEGVGVSAVAARMASTYDVPAAEIEADINDLLCQLREASADGTSTGTGGPDPEKALGKPPAAPFALELELTRHCDWACSFCYNVWKAKRPGQKPPETIHLPADLACSVLDSAAGMTVLRVRYSGGEPTMHPEFDRILTHGAALGLYQVLFTNGRTLNRETARRWKDWNVREVMLSLHGNEPSHDALTLRKGSWRRTMNAIGAAIDNGLEVVVEMTVTSGNVSDVLDVLKTVKSMGGREFRLMRYVPTGRRDEELAPPEGILADLIAQLEQEDEGSLPRVQFPCSPRFCLSEPLAPLTDSDVLKLREKYLVPHCAAGINWASVSHDGKLRICPHSDRYLGDLSQPGASLPALWRDSVQPSAVAALERNERSCGSCPALAICRGGCHLAQFTSTAKTPARF
ncbi:PqqD family peptide modification chaperone [Azospirillum sp. A26]|uniref:radical SAM protein n=1 Tax=Azospirillum sp. A26 TaxID=3160607 RepID=UPI00366BA30D